MDVHCAEGAFHLNMRFHLSKHAWFQVVTLLVVNLTCFQDGVSPQDLHIARLSWAYGDVGAEKPKFQATRLIRPDGWALSPAVAERHDISQELLVLKGWPLQKVLGDMFADLRRVAKQDGRVCLHNLEHEAAVLSADLRRAGMDDSFWSQMSFNGLCLMDKVLAKWACSKAGAATVGFAEMAATLLGKEAAHMRQGEQRWHVLRLIRRAWDAKAAVAQL